MTETISGIIAAILILLICQWLSRYFTAKLMAATILVAIAFIYIGFSLQDNRPGFIVLETTVALGLYFLALTGYTKNNNWLGYGIILHGIWDIFHHQGWLIGTDIPSYWPSFCFIIDIIDGIYFVIVFKRQQKQTLRATPALF